MIKIYVPAPSRPERFTLLTPFQLIGLAAYVFAIPVFTALLFPVGN